MKKVIYVLPVLLLIVGLAHITTYAEPENVELPGTRCDAQVKEPGIRDLVITTDPDEGLVVWDKDWRFIGRCWSTGPQTMPASVASAAFYWEHGNARILIFNQDSALHLITFPHTNSLGMAPHKVVSAGDLPTNAWGQQYTKFRRLGNYLFGLNHEGIGAWNNLLSLDDPWSAGNKGLVHVRATDLEVVNGSVWLTSAKNAQEKKPTIPNNALLRWTPNGTVHDPEVVYQFNEELFGLGYFYDPANGMFEMYVVVRGGIKVLDMTQNPPTLTRTLNTFSSSSSVDRLEILVHPSQRWVGLDFNGMHSAMVDTIVHGPGRNGGGASTFNLPGPNNLFDLNQFGDLVGVAAGDGGCWFFNLDPVWGIVPNDSFLGCAGHNINQVTLLGQPPEDSPNYQHSVYLPMVTK